MGLLPLFLFQWFSLSVAMTQPVKIFGSRIACNSSWFFFRRLSSLMHGLLSPPSTHFPFQLFNFLTILAFLPLARLSVSFRLQIALRFLLDLKNFISCSPKWSLSFQERSRRAFTMSRRILTSRPVYRRHHYFSDHMVSEFGGIVRVLDFFYVVCAFYPLEIPEWIILLVECRQSWHFVYGHLFGPKS